MVKAKTESCVSFDDLFEAAQGRRMTIEERQQLKQLPQPALNDWVKAQAASIADRIWVNETEGTDGVTYVAFGWNVLPLPPDETADLPAE